MNTWGGEWERGTHGGRKIRGETRGLTGKEQGWECVIMRASLACSSISEIYYRQSIFSLQVMTFLRHVEQMR